MRKVLILFYMFFCFGAKSNPLIDLSEYKNRKIIGKSIRYEVDTFSNLTINDIVNKKFLNESKEDVPNFGLNNYTYWIKIIINSTIDNNEFLLELANPLCDIANLYYLNERGIYEVQKSGDNFNFHNRKYLHSNFLFDIHSNKNNSQVYYLQIRNKEQCQVPIYIGSKENILYVNNFNDILTIIFFTILMVMFIYNFFLFYSIKDNAYLLYVLYIASIGLAQIGLRGYGFKWFWPNWNWFQQHHTFILGALVAVTSLEFFKKFIGLKNISKGFRVAIKAVYIGYAIAVILPIVFKEYKISYMLLQILALFAVCIGLFASIIARKNNVASAKYFLYAWVVFILGIFVFVLKDFNVIPYSTFSIYTMPAGSAIEVILLSFALANRIKILQNEKADILNNLNVTLNKQVKEKTKDLQSANSDLEVAMANLKRQEVELVNKEKMSSLGVLTAGIAHEINNPINFVTSSIAPLKRDIKDVLQLLDEYSKLDKSTENAEKFKEIEQMHQQLDTPYLIEEINLLLQGIEEGAFRTAGIVKGLQKFSRSDEHIFRNSDIIDGIENTLTLLNSQIKDKIIIKKDYKEIPPLYCSIGKLNQVFLNLLSNAIYAVIENKNKEKAITIKTEVVNNNLVISFIDNGIGMPAEVKSKIFDPFFTTKEVGQGTGLGLAISVGIVHDHHGYIKVESTEGIGSTIQVILPITEGVNDSSTEQ